MELSCDFGFVDEFYVVYFLVSGVDFWVYGGDVFSDDSCASVDAFLRVIDLVVV